MASLKNKLKTILVFDTIALGGIYVVNRIISTSSILKNLLNPGIGNDYQWKYGNIYYRKLGKGSPLLLIHNLDCASSAYEWNQMEIKLSKNHTVYTIDLLGCGRSAKPGLTYTNYLYVQLISDFVRDIIGKKTDVAVTGLSSSFITMAAYANKDLFDHIILVNPVSLKKLNSIPNEKSKIIRTIMSIPIIGTAIYHMKVCKPNIEYYLTENAIFNPFHIPSKLVDAYYESAHRGFGNGKYLMASLDGFYLNVNIQRALQNLSNEITILYGKNVENGKETAESYREINSSISIKSLSDTKLLPQLEMPEEMYKQIEHILK